jgi:histidyl-tRNA synthetase
LIEDEALRADSLKLVQDLRQRQCAVEYSLTPAKPDKQFKRALELKASHTVRLERAEAGGMRVKVKSLKDRQEKVVPLEEVLDLLCTAAG